MSFLKKLFGGKESPKVDINDVVRSGDVEKVKALLKGNPDLVFGKDPIGNTLLHYAAIYGAKDLAELVLANKADANAKDDGGMTPLHWAAFAGHKDVVELLLANKADINVKNNKGLTPLHCAAELDRKDVAELLRQHGGHE